MGMRGVVGILLVLLIGAGVAGVAYNAGVAHGLAQSGQTGSVPPGVAPYPYYGPSWHPFGFLFPLLFFFLIIVLLKGLFWGPRWGGYYGRGGGGVPPMFEEWHRRAHEQKRDTGTA